MMYLLNDASKLIQKAFFLLNLLFYSGFKIQI